MSALKISASEAEELFESSDGERVGEWTRITDQTGDSGRWHEHHKLVITNGGGIFGIEFSFGLTESQEHELPWEKSMWSSEEPSLIELVPLVPVEITTTEYLTEKQYEKHLAKTGRVRPIGGTDG